VSSLLFLTVGMGLLLGLLGGGGSIVAVPLLVYVAGLEPRMAIAASLPLVAAAAVAALPGRVRAGQVRWRVGLVFGAAGVVGAHLGGRAAHLLPERLLLAGFGAVMVFSAVALFRCRRCDDGEPAVEGRARQPVLHSARAARLLAQGLAVGGLTGLVGIGGGFLIVPALTLLAGLPTQSAAATSLLVIALNSAAGFSGHVGAASSGAGNPFSDALSPGFVIPLAVAAAVGGFLGSLLARRVPQKQLRRGFAVLVLGLATMVTYRAGGSEMFALFRSKTTRVEAHALVAEGAALVDVRSVGEFEGDHLEGAINIPVDEIERRAAEIGSRDRPVVVYCRSGMRSARAKTTLERLGFAKVLNLGPKSAW
jgi:uncharacterized protein